MFTIKCYSQGRCIIKAADSFTILRTDETGEAEITLHRKSGDDERVDVLRSGAAGAPRSEGWPPVFQWAFIENALGKTIETIRLRGPLAEVA